MIVATSFIQEPLSKRGEFSWPCRDKPGFGPRNRRLLCSAVPLLAVSNCFEMIKASNVCQGLWHHAKHSRFTHWHSQISHQEQLQKIFLAKMLLSSAIFNGTFPGQQCGMQLPHNWKDMLTEELQLNPRHQSRKIMMRSHPGKGGNTKVFQNFALETEIFHDPKYQSLKRKQRGRICATSGNRIMMNFYFGEKMQYRLPIKADTFQRFRNKKSNKVSDPKRDSCFWRHRISKGLKTRASTTSSCFY